MSDAHIIDSKVRPETGSTSDLESNDLTIPTWTESFQRIPGGTPPSSTPSTTMCECDAGINDEVAARERAFHNERFARESDPREPLDKWYHAVRHGMERADRVILAAAAGADVLDYGCATAEISIDRLRLPDTCRSLTGIDISDVAIAKATARAARAGARNTRFLQIDAQGTAFPDASFDLVFGTGILHHLDLERCCREIARILRPGGVAIFSEPMGHNPILNLYRRRTPELRTADEHPLRVADFAIARRHFAKVDTHFYGLFAAISALVDPTATGIAYQLGKATDAVVLRLPMIGRYAWHCLMTFHKAAAASERAHR